LPVGATSSRRNDRGGNVDVEACARCMPEPVDRFRPHITAPLSQKDLLAGSPQLGVMVRRDGRLPDPPVDATSPD
jgi:hypothetical protein